MYFKEDSVIFSNGDWVAAGQAGTGLYSQSLHYGNGVFEGIRSYKTKSGAAIFEAHAHYDRLLYGAKVMGIPCAYTAAQLVDYSYELLRKNKLEDAYIRPLIITGADMSLRTSNESTVILQCWEWGKYMGDKLLRIKTSRFERPNPKSCFVDAKVTGHYVNSILATNEAKDAGYDEALLLDMHGNVAECSGANVFMEKDGVLYTPSKGHIMPGITRSTIIRICKELDIEVHEKSFTLADFKTADSAFFTGTAAEVVGLASIDDYTFPQNWEQSHGFIVMNAYKDEVLGLRKQSAHVLN